MKKPKWIVFTSPDPSDESHTKTLNDMDAEGYDVFKVSFYPAGNPNYTAMKAVGKLREKQEESKGKK